MDIGSEKVDIDWKKVDIESLLSRKTEGFSNKTVLHIKTLYESFGDNKVFGRNAVMELLGLKSSRASKLISNLVQAGIIESVSGYGKGKYRFRI